MNKDEQIKVLAEQLMGLLLLAEFDVSQEPLTPITTKEHSTYKSVTGRKQISESDLREKLNVDVNYVRRLMRLVDDRYGTPHYREMKSLTESLSKYMDE